MPSKALVLLFSLFLTATVWGIEYYPGFRQVPFNPPLRKDRPLPGYNPGLILTNRGPVFYYNFPNYSIITGNLHQGVLLYHHARFYPIRQFHQKVQK